MPAHTVFCSACDRNVQLIPRSSDWTWHVVLDRRPDGDVACLDRGRNCTGTLCPFSAETANGGDFDEVRQLDPPAPR